MMSSPLFSIVLKVLTAILTLCYPFAVYWGLQSSAHQWLVLLLGLLLLLRWFTAREASERKLALGFALCLTLIVSIWGLQPGLKLYPVLVNLGLLMTFALTLYFPPSMIERFARLREPELPDSGVRYTRRVTQVWCVFFAINGSIALATVLWASDEIWMLYNGMIAYILIALLVAGEWLVRWKVKQKHHE